MVRTMPPVIAASESSDVTKVYLNNTSVPHNDNNTTAENTVQKPVAPCTSEGLLLLFQIQFFTVKSCCFCLVSGEIELGVYLQDFGSEPNSKSNRLII